MTHNSNGNIEHNTPTKKSSKLMERRYGNTYTCHNMISKGREVTEDKQGTGMKRGSSTEIEHSDTHKQRTIDIPV